MCNVQFPDGARMSRNRFLFIIGTVVALIILTVVLGRNDVSPEIVAASMLATTLRFATPITLGALSGLPVIGPIFRQQPIAWVSVILVIIAHYVLFYTRWGLRTRAVGENPRAADTVGIKVKWMRYANVLIGAGIAGLGGAYFTLEAVPSFETLITNGRGFIALAAMIFGGWTPFGAWAAALLFGAAYPRHIN